MPRRGVDRVPTGDGSDLLLMCMGGDDEGKTQPRKGKKDDAKQDEKESK